MVDAAAIAAQTADTLYFVVWVVLFMLIIIGIVVILMLILPYKHYVRVRELTGDKTRIIDDKAREIKQHGVVTKWKLRKRKHFIPIPPAQSIHLTAKGKLSVECYFTQEGEYKYIKDNGINANQLAGFMPLTTVDREFYANEMAKKERYKKKSIWDYVMPAAGFVVILGVFILMLIFWEDIAKPGIRISEIAASTAEQQRETAEHMSRIMDSQTAIIEQQRTITELIRDVVQKSQTLNPSVVQNANSSNIG